LLQAVILSLDRLFREVILSLALLLLLVEPEAARCNYGRYDQKL